MIPAEYIFFDLNYDYVHENYAHQREGKENYF